MYRYCWIKRDTSDYVQANTPRSFLRNQCMLWIGDYCWVAIVQHVFLTRDIFTLMNVGPKLFACLLLTFVAHQGWRLYYRVGHPTYFFLHRLYAWFDILALRVIWNILTLRALLLGRRLA